MMRVAGFVGLLAVAFGAAAQSDGRTLSVAPKPAAPAEARTALVIGNSAYTNGPLRNPVNDARAMAKALGETGFDVILLENATQANMQRGIRSFGDKIAKGGVGLFYFAGHGLQVKGRNYLVPVNAEIAREDEIEFDAVDVNLVLAKMDSAKNALNIVILDACRNNPFARSFRSVQSGLAQMDAPTGTFIAFATAPGSVAADGTGDNGVYTKYLLSEMQKPGVQIEQLFKQVRIGVMAETRNQQIPWESSSLRGEFSFKAGVLQPSVAEAVAEALKRDRAAQRAEMERMLAAALERQRAELQAAGLKPPEPPKVEPAAIELSFWDSVKASVNPADFRAYLEQYPHGRFAALAKNRISALDTKPVTPLAAPPAAVVASLAPAAIAQPQSTGGRLPQAGDVWTYRLREPRRVDGPKERSYTVRVAAASPAGVLERYSIDPGPSGEWAHAAGGYLVALGPSLFSPYLAVFEDLAAGASLGSIAISDRACTGSYVCQVEGKVRGRETVKTAAGSFEAIKVTVEQSWAASSGAIGQFTAQYNGGRRLTVWYSPQVKRAVKFSSRLEFGTIPPIEADFDLELVSYKLQ
jgi:hypothetical protein